MLGSGSPFRLSVDGEKMIGDLGKYNYFELEIEKIIGWERIKKHNKSRGCEYNKGVSR